MKLAKILKDVALENPLVPANKDLEISDLSFDSRQTKPGHLFFAVPGFSQDGTKYVPNALKAGAAACVVEMLEAIPDELRDQCILVKNVREALADASGNFFGHPSEELMLLGITGTKGKTSTAFLVESIFAASGKKTALLGTVVCRHPGKSFHSPRTTMESYDLQKFLREALSFGAEVAVLEVSSHALSLARVRGCRFDGMLFTNLSEDHLDFYGDMEKYYEAKRLLFTEFNQVKNGQSPVAVVNQDNSYGARLLHDAKMKIFSYGEKGKDYSVIDSALRPDSTKGILLCPEGERIFFESKLSGHFNLSNIIGAMALAHALGVRPREISKGIGNLEYIPGRLERIETPLPFQVFVDFAHMGNALENVLNVLRPLCQGRLILVFGAGGDRDPMRRVQLGQVAAKLADHSLITSDNPRTEDPKKIISAIEVNYQEELARHPELKDKRSYEIEADRGKAIRRALTMAKAGDVICLAGKGHETGQIIGTEEFPFDDREEARKVLREISRA